MATFLNPRSCNCSQESKTARSEDEIVRLGFLETALLQQYESIKYWTIYNSKAIRKKIYDI